MKIVIQTKPWTILYTMLNKNQLQIEKKGENLLLFLLFVRISRQKISLCTYIHYTSTQFLSILLFLYGSCRLCLHWSPANKKKTKKRHYTSDFWSFVWIFLHTISWESLENMAKKLGKEKESVHFILFEFSNRIV